MYKEHENEHYFFFLDGPIQLISMREDGQKTCSQIRLKLKEKGYRDVFDRLFSYCCLKRASVRLKDLKLRESDYDAYHESVKLLDETESLLNEYVESLEKDFFLEAISEITYWMAIIELERQISLHKQYLNSWLVWHKYLTSKDKNKREGEKMLSKLKLILGDKFEDNKIKDEYLKDTKWRLERSNLIFVNIDDELDYSRSLKNKNFCIPHECERDSLNGRRFRVLKGNTRCIVVDGDILSLKEYYETIKHEINFSWIRDKDIIKQIVTVFLIKRSQQGDEEAFDILFGIYKKRAESVYSKFAIKRPDLDKYEVESKGVEILVALLKGDSPVELYKSLHYGQKEKSESFALLNRMPHKALNEAYELQFRLIDGQLKVINNNLEKLRKSTKNYRNRAKQDKKLETKRQYFQNIFTISQWTLSRIQSAPMMFMMSNPLDMLRMSDSYNRELFHFGKNKNLTIWLFGNKEQTFKGKIYERLSDEFKTKGKVNVAESFDEDAYLEVDDGVYRKTKSTND